LEAAFFVLSRHALAIFTSMTYRLRHCAECPNCGTRYLVGFSPYSNGSYLLPIEDGGNAQWTLYCRCIWPPARSSWRATDLKTYDVSGCAHQRGYGSPEEIVQFGGRTQRWPY
jgi:hypothetical protein